MHKPAQVELQLDRSQLPYSEILGPIIAGGNPAHYRRRQPNPTKKGPYIRIVLNFLLCISFGIIKMPLSIFTVNLSYIYDFCFETFLPFGYQVLLQ